MSTKAENCPSKKEESKQRSDKEEEETPKNVHSANNWEGVDLGDDDRKKKFLRLMGAAKKDHHGKIIIGDHDAVHARSRDETVHINEDLEDQFKQGLEHRMAGGFKGHLGLGFHDEEKKKEVEEKVEEKKESEGENKGDNCETDKPPESTKKEDSETSQESPKKHKMEESKEEEEGKDESVKKKMKMNFVKASS